MAGESATLLREEILVSCISLDSRDIRARKWSFSW